MLSRLMPPSQAKQASLRWQTAALLALTLSASSNGATLHFDDFSTDLQGWGGGAGNTFVATGGPAGELDGFMQIASNGFNNVATHNADARWIGDYLAIQGEQIEVDLRNAVGSEPLTMRVVLFGPGGSISTTGRWTSSEGAAVPADGVWRRYVFPLTASSFVQVKGTAGIPFASVMGNVAQIMLRHDPGEPSEGGMQVTATLDIDNVTLGLSPPPPLRADFNDDSRVDAADLTLWEGELGTGPGADANQDGFSDGADFLVWQTEFGSGPPPADVVASTRVAPEPTACCCAALVAAAGVLKSGRRPRL